MENQTEQPKQPKPFTFKVKPFSDEELQFWQQFGITPPILAKYQVASLKEFVTENNENKHYKLLPTDKEPLFAYQGKRYLKLYHPFSTVRFQYAGDLGDKYCFGLEQLPPKGNILFITGGEKDVLSLVSKGYFAICFNSETSNVPQGIIRKLTYRFKHVVILYDCDKTGIESSAKHENLIKRCHPEKGDVLLTKSGTIGRLAIVPDNIKFSLFVSVALLKPQNEVIYNKYLMYSIENYINNIDIKTEIKGGVLKNFHLEDIRETKIPVCEIDMVLVI